MPHRAPNALHYFIFSQAHRRIQSTAVCSLLCRWQMPWHNFQHHPNGTVRSNSSCPTLCSTQGRMVLLRCVLTLVLSGRGWLMLLCGNQWAHVRSPTKRTTETRPIGACACPCTCTQQTTRRRICRRRCRPRHSPISPWKITYLPIPVAASATREMATTKTFSPPDDNPESGGEQQWRRWI